MKNIFSKISTIGADKDDSSEVRLQKQFLVYLGVSMSFGGLVWGILMSFYDLKQQAVIPFAYVLLTITNLIYFYFTHNFKIVRSFQTCISLLLPFLMQWWLGGFVASGVVVLWSILALIATLTFQNSKSSIFWLVFFLIGVAITGVIDERSSINIPVIITTEISRVFVVLNIMFVASIVYGLVAYFVRKQQLTQSRLNLSNENLSKAFDTIQKTHKDIKDSIEYARHIQQSILLSEKNIEKFGLDYYQVFKPKDIVSGDFYWFEKHGDIILFAVADCTGHGVPGAIVSVLCNNALSRTVREFKLIQPAQILNKVRDLILETFRKGDDQTKDGMDIALCSLNIKNNELQFAGAFNSLYHITKTKKDCKEKITNGKFCLKEIKADRQPIGKFDKPIPFTNHTIQLEKGDSIILFTDGYADQFGGEKGGKYKYTPLKKLLLSINDKSAAEQKEILEDTFEKWKGSFDQVDDVCLIGIKV